MALFIEEDITDLMKLDHLLKGENGETEETDYRFNENYNDEDDYDYKDDDDEEKDI